jgi:hypothetical protein
LVIFAFITSIVVFVGNMGLLQKSNPVLYNRGLINTFVLNFDTSMSQKDPFKWKHSQKEIILLCVRWYLRYSLSYRDLEELFSV